MHEVSTGISCKGGGGKHDKTCFYFGEGSIFRLLCWGVLHVLTILVIGPIKWLFLKKKTEIVVTPLIN
jgi:hypothetical protein